MVHYRNKDWFTLKDIITLLRGWYLRKAVTPCEELIQSFQEGTFPVIFADYTLDSINNMSGEKIQSYLTLAYHAWPVGIIENFGNYDTIPAFILYNYDTNANIEKDFDKYHHLKACIVVPFIPDDECVDKIKRPDGYKISDLPQLLVRYSDGPEYGKTSFEVVFDDGKPFSCDSHPQELALYLNKDLSITGLKFAPYMEGFPYLGIKVGEPVSTTGDDVTKMDKHPVNNCDKRLPAHYEIRGGYGGYMGSMGGCGGNGCAQSQEDANWANENPSNGARILDEKLLAGTSNIAIHLACDDLGDGRVRVNVTSGMYSYSFEVKPTTPTSSYDVLLEKGEQDFFIDGAHLKVRSDSSEEPGTTRLVISTMDEKETATVHVKHPTSPYIYYGGKRTPIANMKEVGNKHQDQCKQIVINPVDLVTSVDGGLCSVLLKIEKDPNVPNAILVETADGGPIRYFLDSPLNTDSAEHDDSDAISFEPASYLCLNRVKTPIKNSYNHDDYHERNSDKIIIDPEDLIITDDGKHIAAMIEFRPYSDGINGKTFMIITKKRSFRHTI